ncbi:MAG: pyridoxal-phosphate dependent enzyme [Eubacterium sp.]|nr:pyridoxal-phosphate dependent enzyme [Eubacterium sp.]
MEIRKTPIDYIGKVGKNDLYIKRDDLIPFSFGGNKVRIAKELLEDMKTQKCDIMIGYGNSRSNLSRAIANMTASEGIECHIVSSLGTDDERVTTANSHMVSLCNATFHFCENRNVAETVERVLEQCKEKGKKPYYIYGNKYGEGNEAVPVGAYRKAYKEIEEEGQFDYIFLATGTGMTQSGLIVGKNEMQGKEKIIGISIARESENEKKIIKKMIDVYCEKNAIEKITDEINVIDDYVMEGYGKHNQNVLEIIREMFVKKGIPLDMTYTGKAYYGMIEYIKKHQLENKKILFLHTGGTPLFFDVLGKFQLSENECF